MIVVVTGGRDYTPSRTELDRLVEILVKEGATMLRHGSATGVDAAASTYVRRVLPHLRVEDWPAEHWGRWPTCGPLRNRAMVLGERGGQHVGAARLVVAFHGGSGTRNCVAVARANRIRVIAIEKSDQTNLFGDA